MGSFDVYCAICGGPLTSIQIGSNATRALERRQQRVQKDREAIGRRHADEGPGEDSDASEDEWSEHESDDWDEYDEDHSYDPNLGSLDVFVGSDPNQPLLEASFDCYGVSETNRTAVFPFHESCFEILTRALTSSTDATRIDKDLLYDVMARLSGRYERCLKIDYGDNSGRDQFWDAYPGEEALNEKMSQGVFRNLPKKAMVGNVRDPRDSLSKLSHELICAIASYLPGDSLLALRSASRSAYHATCSNGFWKWLIGSTMPWLWDLGENLDYAVLSQINCKALFFWLDKVSAVEFGMIGTFMGIANRRRIWDVSQLLANSYFRLRIDEIRVPDPQIAEQSRCLRMFEVALTQSTSMKVVEKAMWIHSWEEIGKSAAVLETYISEKGLTGIAIVVGTSRRILGSDAVRPGIAKNATRIGTGEWISELTLHVPDAAAAAEGQDVTIVGVSVVLMVSGVTVKLGDISMCRRPLVVSEGTEIVGITGEINDDGVISRIGLLEWPRPSSSSASESTIRELSLPQKLIWSRGHMITGRGGSYDAVPIWSHPSLHVAPVFQASESDTPLDLIPYQVLLWTRDEEELGKLERISAFVASPPDGSAPEALFGLRAEYIQKYWEPKRYVEIKPVEDDRDDPGDWPDDQVKHMEVDGLGGERITEIGVAHGADLKAIMFRTNKENQTLFGEPNQQEWITWSPPEGESIVGVAVAFGSRCDTEKFWKMPSLLALHRKF
ncbi:Fc.00g082940.m01.CDS01 [Cosmosporella sp. VM-42]